MQLSNLNLALGRPGVPAAGGGGGGPLVYIESREIDFGTSEVFTPGVAILEDDIVFAIRTNTAGDTHTITDYTLLDSGFASSGVHGNVNYKVMGSTPDTSFTIPASRANLFNTSCIVFVLRGVDTANIEDVAHTSTYGLTSSTTVTPDAITTATANAFIVMLAATDIQTTVVSFPADTNDQTEIAATTASPTTLAVATATQEVAGTYTPGSFVFNDAQEGIRGTFAFRLA